MTKLLHDRSNFSLSQPMQKSKSSLKSAAGVGLLMLAALALSGCSMASSTQLLEADGEPCRSTVGGYYLSKSYLQVKVAHNKADKSGPIFEGINVVPKADRTQGYCLDFLASPTSHDTFVVAKNNEFLLEKITSRADDQSLAIANNIIQTVFKALEAQAGLRGDLPPEAVRAFTGEYDPFDEAQTALVNDGLKDTGFCLILENPAKGPPIDVESYCNNPFRYARREAALVASANYTGGGKFVNYTRGVLYRPRLPYSLYLFRNRRTDLGLPGDWRLWQSETVYLENISPILSVGVDRTYFANRSTTLSFASGVLQDIRIDKGSELASISEIPLSIASSIAKLPSNIVQAKIDVTNKRQGLIAAQDQLLKQEEALAKSRAALRSARGLPGAGGPQSLPERGAPNANAEKQASSEPATDGGTPPGPENPNVAGCEAKVDQCVAEGNTRDNCRIAHCE